MNEKKAVAEAALFLSEEPLDTGELADVMNLGSPGFVQQVIDELKDDLEDDGRGLKVVESSEGYELVVKSEHVDAVEHLAPHRDLNEAELRTLALIAFNTPVKQSRVVDVRGNRAYGQIKELIARGFVAAEEAGRTKELRVTDRFLDYFDLETPDEFAMQAEQDGWDAEPAEEPGEAEDEQEADDTGEEPEAAEEAEPVAAADDAEADPDEAGEDGTEADPDETDEDAAESGPEDEEAGPTRITDPIVSADE